MYGLILCHGLEFAIFDFGTWCGRFWNFGSGDMGGYTRVKEVLSSFAIAGFCVVLNWFDAGILIWYLWLGRWEMRYLV